MQPIEAVTTCLKKYVTFSGRARRSEFWWFMLFLFVVNLIAGLLDSLLGLSFGSMASSDSGVSASYSSGPIQLIVSLALLLPNIAVGIRRLHDTGRSGWFILFNLIPCVGWIIYLVFQAQDSKGDNEYGPSPKYPGGAPGAPGAQGGYGAPMQ